MNKYIFLIILFVTVLGFTSCSGNSSLEPELAQTSAERELVTVTNEEEKNTETFSNEIINETTALSGDYDNRKTDRDSVSDEKSETYTTISEVITSQEITDSETAWSTDEKAKFNPFADDINEYCGKEVSLAVFYFINRYPLHNKRDGDNFSVLYVFSDGTCRAEVYTNKDHFMRFCNIFMFDEINDPMITLSEELEALDSDTVKDINSLIGQIDFESEYIDHYPDLRDPEILQLAVEPTYDIVDFFAADKDGNLHRILYDYVFPDCYEVLGSGRVQIELDDEYATQVRETLLNSYVVIYWLENYAWKIGE